MKVPCAKLWPAPGTIAAAHWRHVATVAGAINAPLARPCLLAIRGAKPGDLETHELEHKPSPPYRDTGVLLVPGEDPFVLPMTTTAYQRDSKASPDVDRDGRGDVGSIRPGRYVLHDLRAGEEVTFHVRMPDGSDKIPAWRDFSHDGKLSPEEMQRSEDARAGQQVGPDGTYATSILLHGGMDEPASASGAPAKHRFSIGCLTSPRRFRQMIADAAKPHGGLCDLVLVDATALVALLEQPAPEGITASDRAIANAAFVDASRNTMGIDEDEDSGSHRGNA